MRGRGEGGGVVGEQKIPADELEFLRGRTALICTPPQGHLAAKTCNIIWRG